MMEDNFRCLTTFDGRRKSFTVSAYFNVVNLEIAENKVSNFRYIS